MWDCVVFSGQSKGVFNYDFYRTRSQVPQASKIGIFWEKFSKKSAEYRARIGYSYLNGA